MTDVISFEGEKASRYINQALHGFMIDNPDSDYQRGFLAALLIIYREGLGKDADNQDDRLKLLDRLAEGRCEPMHPDENGWSEWIHPIPGYLMQCCDCDLVHEMEFEIVPRDKDNDPAKLNPGESDKAVIIFRARRQVK